MSFEMFGVDAESHVGHEEESIFDILLESVVAHLVTGADCEILVAGHAFCVNFELVFVVIENGLRKEDDAVVWIHLENLHSELMVMWPHVAKIATSMHEDCDIGRYLGRFECVL